MHIKSLTQYFIFSIQSTNKIFQLATLYKQLTSSYFLLRGRNEVVQTGTVPKEDNHTVDVNVLYNNKLFLNHPV